MAKSEFDLLTIARALVGEESADTVEPLLASRRTLANKVGPTAMGLLEQILSRGAVLTLGRRGGWQPSAQLASSFEVRSGRLWERHQPVPLRFSAASMQLLRWLVGSPLSDTGHCSPLRPRAALGLGDVLLSYLSLDLAHRCRLPAQPFARSPMFRQQPLCWLGFPDLLCAGASFGDDGPSNSSWDALVKDQAILLEALQSDLARRWVAIERGKGRVVRLGAMIALGETQRQVLTLLAEQLEQQDRRDLLGFVSDAASRLLRHRPAPTEWIAGIARVGSLSERQQAFCSAGSLLESLAVARRWILEAQGVRFFDEEYEASQLLLRQWEQLGTEGMNHAEQVLRRLQALDLAGAAPGRATPQES